MKRKIVFPIIVLLIIFELTAQENVDTCPQTQPTKGIEDDCIKGNGQPIRNKECCYMVVDYKVSEQHACIRVEKNKDKIKDVINNLKKNDTRIKSVDINCNSSFIELSLVLFFFIFFI